jgi:hypothetical protein
MRLVASIVESIIVTVPAQVETDADIHVALDMMSVAFAPTVNVAELFIGVDVARTT